MARVEQKYEVNQFNGGINTDATELTPVQNTSTDEDNFDILKEGTRRRRLGFDLESASVTSLGVDTTLAFIGSHRWYNVAKQPGVNFQVVQVGSTLYFYDASSSTFVSGVKGFTVDLDSYKAPKATRTDINGISVASGKGVLFVVGESIVPFYIEYDPDTDTISTTEVSIQIRDLTQLDTTDVETEGTTLTSSRKYDLLNQGWYKTDVIIGSSSQTIYIKTKSSNPDTSIPGYTGSILDGYFETFGTYPPKTKPWWVGRGFVTVDVHIKVPGIFNDKKYTKEVEAFSKEAYDLYFGGNTIAPLGHYIVDPFYKDRSASSGISGISAEVEDSRPNAVAFYGGRVFYGLNNTIYFSQVILDDLTASGRCYQDADPTAEDTIGLIASDGGVITIPDMGQIIRMFVVEGALLIFADNGVWTLYSPDGVGFSAINFAVDFVTPLSTVGYHSIVDVEGYPVYWGNNGIYTIVPIPQRVAYEVKDLSDKKIKNYLADNTTFLAKKYAKGVYDKANKRVIWLWKSSVDADVNRFEFDRALNYSTVFDAFFPYSMTIHTPVDGSDHRYAICETVDSSAISTTTSEVNVVTPNIDSLASSVQWHFPFDLTNQLADVGPNLFGNAYTSGTAAISDASSTSIYYSYALYSNDNTNEVFLPDGCMPNRGTSDWTLDFWTYSTSWQHISTLDRGIFISDDTNSDSNNQMMIEVDSQGIGNPSFVKLSVWDSAGTLKTKVGTTGLSNGSLHFISVTRSGNSIYLHVDGNLDGTIDVTGLSYNFNNSTTGKAAFIADGVYNTLATDANTPSWISDARFTNAARYSGSAYTVPTSTFYYGSGIGETEVVDESGVQVVMDQTSITENTVALKYLVLKDSISDTFAYLGAGAFTDTTFLDWDSTGGSDDYTSYIDTFYHLSDDSMLYMQAPWIYTYITRSSTTFPSAEGDGSISDSETGGAWASIT